MSTQPEVKLSVQRVLAFELAQCELDLMGGVFTDLESGAFPDASGKPSRR